MGRSARPLTTEPRATGGHGLRLGLGRRGALFCGVLASSSLVPDLTFH